MQTKKHICVSSTTQPTEFQFANLEPMILGVARLPLEGLLNQVSDPAGLGRSLGICMSNNFPGEADGTGPGTPLQEPQPCTNTF